MQNHFVKLLQGGDLRSIGASNAVVNQIDSQESFDELFACVSHADRLVAMRGLDALEKATQSKPHYLTPYKKTVLTLIRNAEHKEARWHLALLASRLQWTHKELDAIWQTLTQWALNKQESRIVRVNALQALFDLLPQHPVLDADFHRILQQVQQENIPSITARLKKLHRPH